MLSVLVQNGNEFPSAAPFLFTEEEEEDVTLIYTHRQKSIGLAEKSQMSAGGGGALTPCYCCGRGLLLRLRLLRWWHCCCYYSAAVGRRDQRHRGRVD